MTYLPDLHSYLHQSSLLIQAYPNTRITTKYSLPRRPKTGNPTSKRTLKATSASTTTTTPAPSDPSTAPGKEKREPAATLTLKTYHADSGICLKYRTDKAQEVGRLLMGLGRLAKGEIIELPNVQVEDRMEVDGTSEPVGAEGVVREKEVVGKSAAEMTAGQQQQQQSQGGAKKKKKGGKK